MRYTVVWRETALQQLARVWTASTDRRAVNEASEMIDRELAADAHAKGQDYFGDRVLPASPLWALFTVRPDDRLVEVLQVGRPGRDLPHEPSLGTE